jgi:hypothetical protein
MLKHKTKGIRFSNIRITTQQENSDVKKESENNKLLARLLLLKLLLHFFLCFLLCLSQLLLKIVDVEMNPAGKDIALR